MARNQYVGTCYRCGLTVEPGTGHFERHEGKWRTQHAYFGARGAVTCADAKGKARKVASEKVDHCQDAAS